MYKTGGMQAHNKGGPVSWPSGAIRILRAEIGDRNLNLEWSQNTDVWCMQVTEILSVLDTASAACLRLSVSSHTETAQIVLTLRQHHPVGT